MDTKRLRGRLEAVLLLERTRLSAPVHSRTPHAPMRPFHTPDIIIIASKYASIIVFLLLNRYCAF